MSYLDILKCWISRKIKVLWGKVIVQRRQLAYCSAVILTHLWILTGLKVKNYHQISHWFQLVLPATKQPLCVCDHWLVLIPRLVPLHLIATGPLSVLERDYQSFCIVLCMKPNSDTASSQILQKSMFIQLNDAKKVKLWMLLYRHQRGQKTASEKGWGAFQCFTTIDMLKIKANKIYCYKTNKSMFRQTLYQRSVVLSRQRSFNCFYCEAFHWLWRKMVHRHIYGGDLVHVLLNNWCTPLLEHIALHLW